MLLSKAIEGFVVAKLASGYSSNTLGMYRVYLKLLSSFIHDADVDTIKPADLERFMAWVSTEYKPHRVNGDASPVKPATLANTWSAIRSFWGWYDSEFHTGRPDLKLARPRAQAQVVEPFTENEVRALVSAAEAFDIHPKTDRQKPYKTKRKTSDRDVSIILTLLDTGVRVGELCRLKVRDVDLANGEVTVIAYGSGQKTKPRHVYTGKAARRALWRYLAQREDIQPTDPLFLTVEDRPLTRSGISSLLKNLAGRAHVANVHPHRFRYTFAITYLRNGGDVFTLQRILGHSTLDMVKRYLALADADDAETHRRASPADRWRL